MRRNDQHSYEEEKRRMEILPDQEVYADTSTLKKFLAVDTENIISNFDVDQRKLIHHVDTIARSAFTDTQSGNHNAAYEKLREGRRLVLKSHRNSLSTLLKISILPTLAYYFYKVKKHRLALGITLEVINTIDRYEYRRRYPSIHCKKIEQLYNICRIYAKTNQPECYMNTSSQFYTYVLLGRPPKHGISWKNANLDGIPLAVRNSMLLNFHQETIRTSSAFLGSDVRDIFFLRLQELAASRVPELWENQLRFV